MSLPAALELEGIDKHFGGVTALKAAHLHVHRGTVHALLGENGAGKTTLMRIAFGMLRADAGVMRLDGVPVEIRSPAQAIAAGIGMVHQHFALVPTMTVAENVALGGRGLYSEHRSAQRVSSVGSQAGLVLDPNARAGDLTVGGQQRLEIVKALARDARVLVLDEPTAVLAPAEADELLRRLRAFADGGRTVVLITHKLREVLAIADEVTVLRNGATVLSAPATGVSERQLADAIIGRSAGAALASSRDADMELPAGAGPAPAVSGQGSGTVSTKRIVVPSPRGTAAATIAADGISLVDGEGTVRVRDASLEIHAGEIVGIAAVEGSGHRELLRALAGRMPVVSGSLLRPAVVGFVPEDRQQDALILDFSVAENVLLGGVGRVRGRVAWNAVEETARKLLAEYDIRAPGVRVPASTLSGGNQQKLVLARELETAPAALVVENPTRGLDVAAGAAIHARLRAAAARGTAVVVHSSDLDEVLVLASRVLVVFGGKVREVTPDRELVGRAMLGLA